MMGNDSRRRLWIQYIKKCDMAYARKGAISLSVLPDQPPFPHELRGLTCGAKTRKGSPCKMTDLNRGARCKFHGGYSTGPKTEAGKRKSAANLPAHKGEKA